MDIEKIAAKYGGRPVDEMDAIAARYGGKVYQPPPPDVPVISPRGSVSFPDQYTPQSPNYSLMDRALGLGETALTLGTGATGGLLGTIAGFGSQAGQELMSGQFGTNQAADRIQEEAMRMAGQFTYAPRTPAGQEYTQDTAEALSVLAPLAGVTPELQIIQQSMKAAPAMIPAARDAVQQGQKFFAGQKGRQLIEARPQTGKLGVIADTLKRDPYNEAGAQYRLVNGRAVADSIGDQAVKQGYKPGVLAAIKASSQQDKLQMWRMMEVLKAGRKNERYRTENRPADILGDSVVRRVNHLFETKRQAGKELEVAANRLRGKPVDYDQAINQFLDDLDEIGISVDPQPDGVKISLLNSDVEGNVASQQLLERVVNRLFNTKVPDGYDLHRAKQFLDTQVQFGKTANDALAEKTARIVKSLRHNLNETLRNSSDDYRIANTKYSDTIGALDDYQKSAGVSINLEGPNANKALGQASRKLVTNYQSRVNLMDAMERLDKVAKTYGLDTQDDVMNQLLFANELDRMFGSPATGTFKGQIEQSLQTGVQAARQTLPETAVDLTIKGVQKVRGINDENAIRIMEELLSRELQK